MLAIVVGEKEGVWEKGRAVPRVLQALGII